MRVYRIIRVKSLIFDPFSEIVKITRLEKLPEGGSFIVKYLLQIIVMIVKYSISLLISDRIMRESCVKESMIYPPRFNATLRNQFHNLFPFCRWIYSKVNNVRLHTFSFNFIPHELLWLDLKETLAKATKILSIPLDVNRNWHNDKSNFF